MLNRRQEGTRFSVKESVEKKEFLLSPHELAQASFVKCINGAAILLDGPVKKALKEKYPGHCPDGKELWLQVCKKNLPDSIQGHVSSSKPNEFYALAEIMRAFVRSVVVPLIRGEDARDLSRTDLLEEMNFDLSTVLQCRNCLCHSVQLSLAEYLQGMMCMERLLRRLLPRENVGNVDEEKRDSLLRDRIEAKQLLKHLQQEQAITKER